MIKNNHDLSIADKLTEDRPQHQIIHICSELKAKSKNENIQITIKFLMTAIGEQHFSNINE